MILIGLFESYSTAYGLKGLLSIAPLEQFADTNLNLK